MKYTKEVLMQSVFAFLPALKDLHDGALPPLPELLKIAALEIFLKQINGASPQDHYIADHIIRTALLELRNNGQITFGNVNNFWA